MPTTGHLNPMLALAKELRSRGHEIIFFGILDIEPAARGAGFQFVSFAEEEYPLGDTAATYAYVATLQGAEVIRYSFHDLHPRRCAAMLEHLPRRLATVKVDALVIDTIHFYVELVAIYLGLPYVHIWNVLHFDLSGMAPPCIVDLPYDPTPAGIAKNTEAASRIAAAFAPVLKVARSWAEEHGVNGKWEKPFDMLSPLATITQTPKVFDFPGTPMPATFRYAGSLHGNSGRRVIPFDWEKLSGRPLVYASLGTLLNGAEHVFRAILAVAGQLPDFQFVLSVGRNLSLSSFESVPANAIMVAEAPQIELLERAVLCITHAGLNTVLESLSLGVPMIAIPVGFDQPGVANRITYHHLGEVLSLATLTADGLLRSVRTLLHDPSYRQNALYMREALAREPGLRVAADVIEQVLQGTCNTAYGKW